MADSTPYMLTMDDLFHSSYTTDRFNATAKLLYSFRLNKYNSTTFLPAFVHFAYIFFSGGGISTYNFPTQKN